MTRCWSAVVVGCALILLGCSGDASPEATPTAYSAPEAVTAATFCAATPAAAGRVESPDLVEISGIAASRTQDVVWAHNDSGDGPRVFALSPDGAALATYEILAAAATDWEDMAVGPGPDGAAHYLYLADIGDNASIRPHVTVYRAREPEFGALDSDLAIDEVEAIALTFPDGSHDSETLLVDPRNGDLYIVTKNVAGAPSGVYRAVTIGNFDGSLEKVAEIDFAALRPSKEIPAGSGPLPEALGKLPTGGDISPDGDVIAIRTYGTLWMWQRPAGGSIADAFASPPCEAPSAVEAQGEAIAFDADGRGYLTVGEGANAAINRFRVPAE